MAKWGLRAICKDADLLHVWEVLDQKGVSLEHLMELLATNRVNLLAQLKDVGVAKLGDRQRLAGALSRAQKAGQIDSGTPIPHLQRAVWTDAYEAVTVRLQVPAGTKSSHIGFQLDVNSLEITLQSEPTSLTGRLSGIVNPTECTWEIERATLTEDKMIFEPNAPPPADTIVITLGKRTAGPWQTLFHGGDGVNAKRYVPPTPEPDRAEKKAQKGDRNPMEFRQRKLRMPGERTAAADKGARIYSDSIDRRAVENMLQLPAHDHWQPHRAHLIWRADDAIGGRAGDYTGAPEAPEAVEPHFSWIESKETMVIYAKTRSGLASADVRLRAKPSWAEVTVGKVATPWSGSLVGRIDPSRSRADVLTADGELYDTLRLTLVKAGPRLWRAPYPELLEDLDQAEMRRQQLPDRQALLYGDYSLNQEDEQWVVIIPIKAGVLKPDDIRVAVARDALNVHVVGQEYRPLIGGELFSRIDPSECSWTLKPEKVKLHLGKGADRPKDKRNEIIIHLKKEERGKWPDLIKAWYE